MTNYLVDTPENRTEAFTRAQEDHLVLSPQARAATRTETKKEENKMKNKQQNIEINPATAAWFETFPDMSGRQGMTQIIEDTAYLLPGNPMTAMFHDPVQAHSFMLGAWKNIWRHSLVGMKGLFTTGELSLFVDIHNGHMVTPQTYGSNCLAVGVSDSITLEGIDKKWGVDPASILEKINGLTHVQAACLELWANGFWYGAGEEPRDFDKYIAQLA